MKTAVVLVAGAFAFLVGSSAGAWADVVDPKEPMQPIASTLAEGSGAQPADEQSADGDAVPTEGEAPASEEPAPLAAAEPSDATNEAVAPTAPERVRSPAPEAVVRAVPARDRAGSASGGWTVTLTVERGRAATTRLAEGASAFLGHLGDACRIGLANGPGGPVLAFAVLAVALAFERRWVLWARAWADEDRPSYLEALEVIDPG